MSERRRRTRGALITAVLLVAGLLVGTEALLRAKPVVYVTDLVVQGVPPPVEAAADPRTCRRGADDPLIEELRGTGLGIGRVTSDQIVACPAAFDGRQVTYAGEIIGEVLRRPNGAWVQVNDDAYALVTGPIGPHVERNGFNTGLAVWLPDGLHEQLGLPGRPNQRGDIVLLEGEVRSADPEDGGGLTLRAERLELLAPGVEIEEPLHLLQLFVALAMAAIAVPAVIWARRSRGR